MSPYLVVVIVFLGILALASVFFVIAHVRVRRTRGWMRARGVVINSRTGLPSGWGSRYPTFQWVDDRGRTHRHTSLVYQSFAPRPGTPVEVLYDPRDPGKAQIDGFVQSGRVFYLVAGLLAGIGLFGGLFATWILYTVQAAGGLA